MSDTSDKRDPADPGHDHESLTHEVEDYLSGDIEIEREALHDSVAHDYSTSTTGLVPLDRRRPIGHFIALWTTFAAGFSFLFVGTEVHRLRLHPARDDRRNAARDRHLLRVRDLRRLPRVAHRADDVAVDALDLRGHGLVHRVGAGRPRRAGLGRVPGRSDGPDLGRPLQLGRGRGADDHLLRADDLQQPVRLHRHQHLRPVYRHAADHPVDPVPRDQGADQPSALARRSPQEHARARLLAGRRRRDRVRDVGQRARRLALRQAQVHLADPGVLVRARRSDSCCSRSGVG